MLPSALKKILTHAQHNTQNNKRNNNIFTSFTIDHLKVSFISASISLHCTSKTCTTRKAIRSTSHGAPNSTMYQDRSKVEEVSPSTKRFSG